MTNALSETWKYCLLHDSNYSLGVVYNKSISFNSGDGIRWRLWCGFVFYAEINFLFTLLEY